MQKTDLREKPRQAIGELYNWDDHSDLLPAIARGLYSLVSMTFRVDPYVLYDARGHIVYEWPCGITPHWTDIFDVCKNLGVT